jgi:hypothetical protein
MPTKDELLAALRAQARALYGQARTEELAAGIETTAEALATVWSVPLDPLDEAPEGVVQGSSDGALGELPAAQELGEHTA